MRKSKFTETQIVSMIKEAESGIPVPEICRKHGIGQSTFYKWRSKYGGMEASDVKRLKELEEESAHRYTNKSARQETLYTSGIKSLNIMI